LTWYTKLGPFKTNIPQSSVRGGIQNFIIQTFVRRTLSASELNLRRRICPAPQTILT